MEGKKEQKLAMASKAHCLEKKTAVVKSWLWLLALGDRKERGKE